MAGASRRALVRDCETDFRKLPSIVCDIETDENSPISNMLWSASHEVALYKEGEDGLSKSDCNKIVKFLRRWNPSNDNDSEKQSIDRLIK